MLERDTGEIVNPRNISEYRKELENGNVYVQTIMVGQGRTLKRIRTAPQGRAARIRKRSNHVTIVVGTKQKPEVKEEA